MRQIGPGMVTLAVVAILLGVAAACVVGRCYEKGTSVAKTCETTPATPAQTGGTAVPKQEPTLAPPRPASDRLSSVGQRQVIEIQVEAEQVSPDAASRTR